MPAPPGPAGYSGTPLARKLGIGEDDEVAVVGAPDGFAARLAAEVGDEAVLREGLDGGGPDGGGQDGPGLFDVIITFVTERAGLAADLGRLRGRMAPACGLWVAWPKRASGLPTDMSDGAVREIALPTGLVDNKVCAIDETWSALRLVIRRENR